MSKLWKFENPIPWITNDDKEDFFAAIGDYRLRVEQMDTLRWWWRVSYKEEPIKTALNEYSTCRTNAIRLAEGVYYGHLAACREYEQTIIKTFQTINKQP